jgi:hypothetical protein
VAVDGFALYGAVVGTAALAWQAGSWRADRRHADEVAERARQVDTIRELQCALDEVAVATAGWHSARFKPVRAWGGETIRDIWDPSQPVDTETDRRVAEACARVARLSRSVDDELRAAAERCLELSTRITHTTDVNVSRDTTAELAGAVRQAHAIADRAARS